MKLKTLLCFMDCEWEVKIVVCDKKELEELERFTAKVHSDKMKQYEEYWITFVDMEDNVICIADYDN